MAFTQSSSPTSQDYDYSSSGIDNFLNRSIDQVSWQTTLDAMLNFPGAETLQTLPTNPNTNTANFQSMQISGSMGNTLAIGNIGLNGSQGNIILSDGNNDRVLIGQQAGGF